MKRSKALACTTRRRRHVLGALAVTTGALLLGACGGTSLPGTHSAAQVATKGACHSFVSCLAKKAGRGPTPAPAPAPSRRSELGPSALGPLASELSSQVQQVMLTAMDGLSPRAASNVTARLDALSATDATRLAADLTQIMGADPTGAQAYAGALVGTGGAGAAQALSSAELQAFSAGFDPLPGALSEGNSQVASFVSQILSTTVPHIESLMENALGQVAPQVVPLLLADANRGLQAASANPANLGDYVALLEDPSAEALATRTAYQAGYACGSTLYNTCTSFDRWVLSVSGLKTAPPLIQQDIVDCVALPLCTQVQYQGIVSWVDQVAADSAASAAELRGMSAEMEANSYVATEAWMEAF